MLMMSRTGKDGSPQRQIVTRQVVGVTTNPSIFQQAMNNGTSYQQQLTPN